MPKVALADSLTDWNNLIVNASRHEADDPELAKYLEALRGVLAKTLETAAIQQKLDAERQVTTRMLSTSKEEGKELAMRVRLRLKAMYGPTSPSLHGFGIRPRPHGKRAPQTKIQLPLHSAPAPGDSEE
jgi:uncharacterized protein YfdQ (DUF2303 family)